MVQHYGPKMRALHSDRQRAFVIELSKQSKQNQTAAYRAAGFGNNTKADTGNANVLAGRQDIIDALSEVMEGKSKLSVPAAMARLNKVIESGKGDPGAVRAAISALDRGGLTPKQRIEHAHTFAILDNPQQLERIELLARALNLNVAALMGHRTVKELQGTRIIDVTPEEVEDEPGSIERW